MIGEGEGGVSGQEGRLRSCKRPSHSRTTKYKSLWLVRTASVLLIVLINSRNAYVTPSESVRACLRKILAGNQTGTTKVVIRVQPVREYAVSARTDQWIQPTHLWYIVMLAQSFQLLVKLVNTVFMCHMGLLCDLFKQLPKQRQQKSIPAASKRNLPSSFGPLQISSPR